MLCQTDLIFNQLPCYIFWKDIHSVFMGCNKLFSDGACLGTSPEIIGRTDFDLPWTAMADKYRTDDQEVVQGVVKHNIRELLFLWNDTYVEILTSKVPFFNAQNKIIGILGTFQIISNIHIPHCTKLKIDINSSMANTGDTFLKLLGTFYGKYLTTREIDCISLWIAGISIKQSAKILGISPRTVEMHRDNIKSKLSLDNKQMIIDHIHEKKALDIVMNYAKLLCKLK